MNKTSCYSHSNPNDVTLNRAKDMKISQTSVLKELFKLYCFTLN